MIKKISISITLLILIIPVAYSSEGPDDFLKKSVQEVTALVSEHKERFEKDENFLRSKMNSVVMPKLDITLMSKIILGKEICSDTSAVTSSTDFFKKSSGPSDEYAEGVISIKKVMKIDIFLII